MQKQDAICNYPHFNDVNEVLRHYNRGAIMATIFESLYHKGIDVIEQHLSEYCKAFPESEKEVAINNMLIHLNTRGYKLVS